MEINMLLDFLAIGIVTKNFRQNFQEELYWVSQQKRMLRRHMEKIPMMHMAGVVMTAWDIGKNLELESHLDLIKMAG